VNTTYAIVIVIVLVSTILFTIVYYTTLEPASVSDWTAQASDAACTVGAKNGYGLPSIIICPSNVVHNVTIGKSALE